MTSTIYRSLPHPVCTLQDFETAVTLANHLLCPLEEQVNRITTLTDLIKQSGGSSRESLPSLIDTKRPAAMIDYLVQKVINDQIKDKESLLDKYSSEDAALAFRLAMDKAAGMGKWRIFNQIIDHPHFLKMAATEIGANPIRPVSYREEHKKEWDQYNQALKKHGENQQKRKAGAEIFFHAARICLNHQLFSSLEVLCQKAEKVAADFFNQPWVRSQVQKLPWRKKCLQLIQIIRNLNPILENQGYRPYEGYKPYIIAPFSKPPRHDGIRNIFELRDILKGVRL